jgi:hypothetical protein
MTYSEKTCQDLYEEYKRLSEKVQTAVHTYRDNKLETPTLDQNEVLRKEEIRRELLGGCRKHLNLKDEEWIEIESG